MLQFADPSANSPHRYIRIFIRNLIKCCTVSPLVLWSLWERCEYRGLAVGLPIDGSELDFRRWQEIFFLLSTKSGAPRGLTQPRILSIEEVLSFGVKRPECEVNHSPPSSAALNNEWVYTSTPPHAFMACTGTTVLVSRMYVRCVAVFSCVVIGSDRWAGPMTECS